MKETIVSISIDSKSNTIIVMKKMDIGWELVQLSDYGMEYNLSIEFNRNEITIGVEDDRKNGIRDFLSNCINNPHQCYRYKIEYQQKLYELSTDEIIALFLYQFKRVIHKSNKIIQIDISLSCGTINSYLIKACQLLGITNVKINGKTQRKITMKPHEYNQIREIIQKQEQYLSFKQHVYSIQSLQPQSYENEIEKELFTCDPNDYYTENKLYEISSFFSFEKRSVYRLYKLEKHCLKIASSYFDSIDDYISLEFVSKRTKGIMESFYSNPLPLTKQNIQFFPNIKTYCFYTPTDQLVKTKTITSFKFLYPVSQNIIRYVKSKYPTTRIDFTKIIYSL